MYQQSNPATGAKWLFWLAIIILVAVFALGFNIKDAKWLNGKIAAATAEQMNVATDIEHQESELNLQILRNKTELQIAREKQQAEYENAQRQQEINALSIANSQKAGFRNGLYNTINLGLTALMIAISVAVVFLGIGLSFGLHKVMAAKAQMAQLDRSSVVILKKPYHQTSLAAQRARQREQQERESQIKARNTDHIFKNSRPIWPSEDRSDNELTPSNYPWGS